jgi:hypothetical protein
VSLFKIIVSIYNFEKAMEEAHEVEVESPKFNFI